MINVLLIMAGSAAILFLTFGIIVPKHTEVKMRKELTSLVPSWKWEIKVLGGNWVALIHGVPILLSLQEGISKNGVYGYQSMKLCGIGHWGGVEFKRGTNVFKFWLELQRFYGACRKDGLEIFIENSIEDEYKDLKQAIKDLDNLKLVEEEAKAG